MPFELGMARGLWLGDQRREQFVFVDEHYLLPSATSDLVGCDPVSFGSDGGSLLRCLLGAFYMVEEAKAYPEPDRLISLLPEAHQASAEARRRYRRPIWKRTVQEIDRIVRKEL